MKGTSHPCAFIEKLLWFFDRTTQPHTARVITKLLLCHRMLKTKLKLSYALCFILIPHFDRWNDFVCSFRRPIMAHEQPIDVIINFIVGMEEFSAQQLCFAASAVYLSPHKWPEKSSAIKSHLFGIFRAGGRGCDAFPNGDWYLRNIAQIIAELICFCSVAQKRAKILSKSSRDDVATRVMRE